MAARPQRSSRIAEATGDHHRARRDTIFGGTRSRIWCPFCETTASGAVAGIRQSRKSHHPLTYWAVDRISPTQISIGARSTVINSVSVRSGAVGRGGVLRSCRGGYTPHDAEDMDWTWRIRARVADRNRSDAVGYTERPKLQRPFRQRFEGLRTLQSLWKHRRAARANGGSAA